LLDESEVESRCEGDCLQVSAEALRVVGGDGAVFRVLIGSWNRGVLAPFHVQAGNGLHEWCVRVEVGIGDAAVARPKTGIDRELREICKPAYL